MKRVFYRAGIHGEERCFKDYEDTFDSLDIIMDLERMHGFSFKIEDIVEMN